VGRRILLGCSWTTLVKSVEGLIMLPVDEVLVANRTSVVTGAVLTDSWSSVIKVTFDTAKATPSQPVVD
jgi:hypothetical protein